MGQERLSRFHSPPAVPRGSAPGFEKARQEAGLRAAGDHERGKHVLFLSLHRWISRRTPQFSPPTWRSGRVVCGFYASGTGALIWSWLEAPGPSVMVDVAGSRHCRVGGTRPPACKHEMMRRASPFAAMQRVNRCEPSQTDANRGPSSRITSQSFKEFYPDPIAFYFFWLRQCMPSAMRS